MGGQSVVLINRTGASNKIKIIINNNNNKPAEERKRRGRERDKERRSPEGKNSLGVGQCALAVSDGLVSTAGTSVNAVQIGNEESLRVPPTASCGLLSFLRLREIL